VATLDGVVASWLDRFFLPRCPVPYWPMNEPSSVNRPAHHKYHQCLLLSYSLYYNILQVLILLNIRMTDDTKLRGQMLHYSITSKVIKKSATAIYLHRLTDLKIILEQLLKKLFTENGS
jgi:hypothetical protein